MELDDRSRGILLELQKESPLHVRALMGRLKIHQTPLYNRIVQLGDSRLIKEGHLGNKRVLYITAKGHRALMKDTERRTKDLGTAADAILANERFAAALERKIEERTGKQFSKQSESIKQLQDEVAKRDQELKAFKIRQALPAEYLELFNTKRLTERDPKSVAPGGLEFFEKNIQHLTEEAKTVGIDEKEIQHIKEQAEARAGSFEMLELLEKRMARLEWLVPGIGEIADREPPLPEKPPQDKEKKIKE